MGTIRKDYDQRFEEITGKQKKEHETNDLLLL
jgi:hypothetical protein